MPAEKIEVGMHVRYPRTGTSGVVIRLDFSGGATFAELDTTHLLYRTDQLILATINEKSCSTIIEDAKGVIAREREFASGGELADAMKNIDQSCEGGG